jgi:hypothetical protein
MTSHAGCDPEESCPHGCSAAQPLDLDNADLSGIVTSYDFPPIPVRDMDWSAVRDGYEGGDRIGYGRTEAAAIRDLLELEAEAQS